MYRDAIVFVNGWFVGPSRERLQRLSLRHHRRREVRRAATSSRCASTRRSPRAGSTRAPAFIATSGWRRPRRSRVAPVAVFVQQRPRASGPGPRCRIEARLANAAAGPADAPASGGTHRRRRRRQVATPRSAPVLGWPARPPRGHADPPRSTRPISGRPKIRTSTSSSRPSTVGGAVVDRVETPFGIRTVRFDAENGFFLNGQPYVSKAPAITRTTPASARPCRTGCRNSASRS